MVAWTRRPQRNSRAPDETRCLDQGPEGMMCKTGRLGCHTQRGLMLAKDVRGEVTGCVAGHALLGPERGPRRQHWAGLGQREGPAPP